MMFAVLDTLKIFVFVMIPFILLTKHSLSCLTLYSSFCMLFLESNKNCLSIRMHKRGSVSISVTEGHALAPADLFHLPPTDPQPHRHTQSVPSTSTERVLPHLIVTQTHWATYYLYSYTEGLMAEQGFEPRESGSSIHTLFFFFFNIYLFIYGCVGSSFLCEGFL